MKITRLYSKLRWFGLFLLLPLHLSPASAAGLVSGTVYLDANVNGVFDAGDRPLARVLVSDGAQIVCTDAQGRYALPLPSSGSLVRLSIPTGYWPRNDRWFARVAPAASATCDFPLRADEQPSTWRFVQVTDIHYINPAFRQLRTFGTQVNALKPAPAFIMATGDLVMDSNPLTDRSITERAFGDYLHIMARLKAPLFNLPGNHDLPGVTGHLPPEAPLYGLRGYEALVGPAWYSFNYAGVHILALDASVITPGNVRGGFSEACLGWMRADLSLIPPEQPLLVFLHQHPATWRNPEDLQGALAGRKVLAIFCGHAHRSDDFDWAGYHVYEGGALCGDLWLFRCLDHKPRGFRTVTVSPAGVESQYVYANSPGLF